MNATNPGFSMTPAEAFAAIPLAAVCSDNNFDRKEAHVLKEQLINRSPYRSMTPLAFGELIDGLLRLLRRDHWHELAYLLAVPLVFSDRVVKPEEEAFLGTLRSELSPPPGRTDQGLVEVTEVRHGKGVS